MALNDPDHHAKLAAPQPAADSGQAFAGYKREVLLTAGGDLQITPHKYPHREILICPNSEPFRHQRSSPMDCKNQTIFLSQQSGGMRIAGHHDPSLWVLRLTSCQMTRKLYLEYLTRVNNPQQNVLYDANSGYYLTAAITETSK